MRNEEFSNHIARTGMISMSPVLYHVTTRLTCSPHVNNSKSRQPIQAIKCHLHPLRPLHHLNSRRYITTGPQSLQMKAHLPLSDVSCSPPLRTIFSIAGDRRKIPHRLFPRSRRNENYRVPKSSLLSLISTIEGMNDKVFHAVFFFGGLLGKGIVYHNVPLLVR